MNLKARLFFMVMLTVSALWSALHTEAENTVRYLVKEIRFSDSEQASTFCPMVPHTGFCDSI